MPEIIFHVYYVKHDRYYEIKGKNLQDFYTKTVNEIEENEEFFPYVFEISVPDEYWGKDQFIQFKEWYLNEENELKNHTQRTIYQMCELIKNIVNDKEGYNVLLSMFIDEKYHDQSTISNMNLCMLSSNNTTNDGLKIPDFLMKFLLPIFEINTNTFANHDKQETNEPIVNNCIDSSCLVENNYEPPAKRKSPPTNCDNINMRKPFVPTTSTVAPGDDDSDDDLELSFSL